MARDLNMWQGIGRLGRDPESRSMPNGDLAVNFSIACDDSYNNKGTGEKVEQTEWVRVSAFGKLAEIINQWVVKGQQVYIQGKLRTRKWTDKDGIERYSTEIIADRMQMLGGKRDSNDERQEGVPEPSAKPAPRATSPIDDDIPF